MWSQIIDSMHNGNAYIYIMLALLFVGIFFFCERCIMFYFVYNIDYKGFVRKLKNMVNAEDFDRAMNLCKKTSYTSLPNIALKALEANEYSSATVKGVIEEETLDFMPRLETRVNVFSLLSTLTLLVGVLGTVDALWINFNSISVLDTAQKQLVAGTNIAQALNYTALGLVCSIILILAHRWLMSTSSALMNKLHYGVTALSNMLVKPAVYYSAVSTEGSLEKIDEQEGITDYMQDSEITSESYTETETASYQEGDSSEQYDAVPVEEIKDEEEII